ncbi:MAG: hypothetical protein WAS55_14440 [Saprospiraceae bacterium]|nr:hypothetical protein [Saprospiraceae bacterium]MBK9728154.1 hypothetical protein [Saprospiraceae bacterium]
MKINGFTIIILSFSTYYTFSQNYDNNILIGDYIPGETKPFIVSVIDSQAFFNVQNGIKISLYYPKTSANDSTGNLIFYTDGLNIYGKDNLLMQNGANINPGTWRNYCVIDGVNYKTLYAPQFIPFPGHPDEYILFHMGVYFDSLLTEWHYGPLYYSRINMLNNNGHGGAVEKNVFLLNDIHLANFALCKHGNGRDWWLLTRENNDDRYFTFLIDPEGIHGPFIREISSPIKRGNGFLDIFSKDGKYYIESNDFVVKIYSFDRCNGILSWKTDYILPNTLTYISSVVQTSSDSKYLYLGWLDRLFQLPIVQVNETEIARPLAPLNISNDSVLTAKIGFSIITSNNEFYILSGNGTQLIHKINNPNLPGLSCDFEEDAFRLSNKVWGFTPVYPNYRLSKYVGSGCDTLQFHNVNYQMKKIDASFASTSINKSTGGKSRLALLGKANYIEYMEKKNKGVKSIKSLIDEMEVERKIFYELKKEEK